MPTMTPALNRADTAPPRACDPRLIHPDLMFPLVESTVPGRANAAEEKARAVCLRCPIRPECLAEVLEADMPFGVAGGLTAAERRAVRARGRGPDPEVSAAAASDTRERADVDTVADVGSPEVASVLDGVLAAQARFGHNADPGRVRELVAGRGTTSMTRWDAALAAATMLRLGRTVSATARTLGEQYTQVRRWRDRDRAGEALIRGQRIAQESSGPGAGSGAISTLTAVSSAATVVAGDRMDRQVAA